MKYFNTKVILGVVSIADIAFNQHAGGFIVLWFLYGIYKAFELIVKDEQ
jgi:hypothetical protein